MRILPTVQEMLDERARWTGSVGFVPTLGYLHEGHLSLYRQARVENQTVVASIFVNPTQFAAHEDLERYPRDLERDLHLLESVGVDAVFTPSNNEMYPPGFTTYVVPSGPLVEEGEGALRPGHFRGVATVVLKLFQIVQAHYAYFGQKDAQQVVLIQRMITDFNLPITLRTLPTIRDADGLAMSSRNTYLDPASRRAATVLYRALQAGRAIFVSNPSAKPAVVIEAMTEIVNAEPLARLHYAELRDATTFLPLETLRPPALLLITATVGPTRLLDNFVVCADGSWDTGTFVSSSITE